jgi:hypothetical protein
VTTSDVHANGAAATSLESRLASAVDDGLEPNMRRMLRFIGARDVVELQAIGVRRTAEDPFERVRAAHATSSQSALTLAQEADGWQAQGIYILSSRLKPGVETRRKPNAWHELGKGTSTSDGDIAARAVLPLDFDALRAAHISATDIEQRISARVALRAWEYLTPIVGEASLAYVHSGNGRQVWIALDDMGECPDVKLLVCSILAGLDARFSTVAVKVDLKMGDAKRLVPCAGTMKKKGAAGIVDRPHRRTAIVTSEQPGRLRSDDLWELHARLREECDEAGRAAMDHAKGIKVKPGPARASSRNAGESPFDLANALDPQSVAEFCDLYESGDLRCPGCGESQGVDIIDHGLKCLHNRCEGKGRSGFRTNVDLVMEVFRVDARDAVNRLAQRFGFEGLTERREAGNANGAAPTEDRTAVDEKPVPSPTRFHVLEAPAIWAPRPPTQFVVAGIIPRGSVAMICATGSSLKTWATLDLIVSRARGSPWLGRFACDKGGALFVDWESGEDEVCRRFVRLNPIPVEGVALASMPDVFFNSTDFEAVVTQWATTYGLVAFDSLAAGTVDLDENDARFAQGLRALKRVASVTGAAIVVLHHSRKGRADGDGDERDMPRGSSAIYAAVDVVFQLTRAEDGAFQVRQTKARGGKSVEPFTIRVDDVDEQTTVVRALASPNGRPATPDARFEEVCRALVQLARRHPDMSGRTLVGRLEGYAGTLKWSALEECERTGRLKNIGTKGAPKWRAQVLLDPQKHPPSPEAPSDWTVLPDSLEAQ